MSDGIDVAWLGGNCPVQAEGTFDGVPFYFRARGSSVTCEVGDDWCWEGPVYEWPDAGWIPEDRAQSYIEEAYAQWKRGDYMQRRAEQVAHNRERANMLQGAMRQVRAEQSEEGKP